MARYTLQLFAGTGAGPGHDMGRLSFPARDDEAARRYAEEEQTEMMAGIDRAELRAEDGRLVWTSSKTGALRSA